MTISNATAIPTGRPVGLDPGPAAPVPPVQAATPLAPAVRLDIRQTDPLQPEAGKAPAAKPQGESSYGDDPVERRHTIDSETKTLVYQVVDQNSGDVVVQIPNAVVLKNRAYAEAVAARNPKTERPLDLTA